jgi:hypothetical protein
LPENKFDEESVAGRTTTSYVFLYIPMERKRAIPEAVLFGK